LCHNSLAIALSPDGGGTGGGGSTRRVLGLAGQVLHKRRDVPAGETPSQKRAHPGRESRLWVRGVEAIGPTPAGKRWVDICDRGADTVEFIEHEVRNGRRFVIRVSKDRNLDPTDDDGHFGVGGDRIHRKLRSYAADLPVLGTRRVNVPAVPGKHAARTATVAVSSGPLRLRAGRFARGECVGLPMDLWVVYVREVGPPPPPPAGIQPLEWVLLTNVPADTFGQSNERVDWYEHRPVVEDYHKGQKSGGVDIEGSSRFDETARLEPLIALLSVVAAVLLELRDAGRQRDADITAATERMPPLYVKVLAARAAKRAREKGPRARPPVTEAMSVREFVVELAKLGGFLARKGDGHPGWQTLWRGWAKLQLMAEGVEAIVDQRCVHV
jgi:hypothetical protein